MRRAREHPRHLVLGALVAGLLTATISDAVVLAAAAIAALLTAIPLRPAAKPGEALAPGRADARTAAVPGSPLVVVLVVAAVVAGAVFTYARLQALDAGVLAASAGRSVESRAVVLEPVRERPVGPAVARVRLLDGLGGGE